MLPHRRRKRDELVIDRRTVWSRRHPPRAAAPAECHRSPASAKCPERFLFVLQCGGDCNHQHIEAGQPVRTGDWQIDAGFSKRPQKRSDARPIHVKHEQPRWWRRACREMVAAVLSSLTRPAMCQRATAGMQSFRHAPVLSQEPGHRSMTVVLTDSTGVTAHHSFPMGAGLISTQRRFRRRSHSAPTMRGDPPHASLPRRSHLQV